MLLRLLSMTIVLLVSTIQLQAADKREKTPPIAASEELSYTPPALKAITGKIILVGAKQPITSIEAGLAQAQAGDTVLVEPGTYKERMHFNNTGKPGQPVTLRGIPGPKGERPLIDGTGVSVTGDVEPRALVQIEGEQCILTGFELKNARNGDNGAGVRLVGCKHAIVHDCKITYCDMGIMGGGNETGLIQRCEVAFCGTADFNGYSHNFYLEGESIVVRECYVHDSLFGQNFKTRGHYVELWYNLIVDSREGELGFVDSALSTPANSNVLMVGNVVVSNANRQGNSGKFIDFGGEGPGRTGTLFLFNNTFIAGTPQINFVHLGEPSNDLVAYNNIFLGSDRIAGGKVKGANNFCRGAVNGFANNIGGNPLFVDEKNRDFHLQQGSACVDTGVPADALVYVDGTGKQLKAVISAQGVFPCSSQLRPNKTQLDIGAFEFGVVPTVADKAAKPEKEKPAPKPAAPKVDTSAHRDPIREQLEKTGALKATIPMTVLGKQEETEAVAANKTGLKVRVGGNELLLPWKEVNDEAIARLALATYPNDKDALAHAWQLASAVKADKARTDIGQQLLKVDPEGFKQLSKPAP